MERFLIRLGPTALTEAAQPLDEPQPLEAYKPRTWARQPSDAFVRALAAQEVTGRFCASAREHALHVAARSLGEARHCSFYVAR